MARVEVFLWICVLTMLIFRIDPLKAQCSNYRDFSSIDSTMELYRLDRRAENFCRYISGKFFADSKNYAVPIGYRNDKDFHPTAFAISSNDNSLWPRCEVIAGPSKCGYILIDQDWVESVWEKNDFRTNNEIVFLFAHEIAHIIHANDTLWQRAVEIVRDSSGDGRYKGYFKRDSLGRSIGFFGYITNELVKRAKEFHADYAAGIIVYDLVLYAHDYWIDSDLKKVSRAHQTAYDNILSDFKDFIKKELAPRPSPSHGDARDRVRYFLKGIEDRRRYFKSIDEISFRNRLARGTFPYNVIQLFTSEGINIKEKLGIK
ncbi:MAG: hypothetical protein AAGG75_25535 [Bacteroidota bacterium]